MANEEFAAYMRVEAAKRRIIPDDLNETSSGSEQSETLDESEISDASASNEQLRVTKKQTLAWIKKLCSLSLQKSCANISEDLS